MALTVALTAPFQTSLKRGRLDEAAALVQKFVGAGRVSAAVLHVRQDSYTFHRAFGQAKTPDTIFLLASITKPMTAVGLMVLADRGEPCGSTRTKASTGPGESVSSSTPRRMALAAPARRERSATRVRQARSPGPTPKPG